MSHSGMPDDQFVCLNKGHVRLLFCLKFLMCMLSTKRIVP